MKSDESLLKSDRADPASPAPPGVAVRPAELVDLAPLAVAELAIKVPGEVEAIDDEGLPELEASSPDPARLPLPPMSLRRMLLRFERATGSALVVDFWLSLTGLLDAEPEAK